MMMAEDAAPLVEALVAIVDAARAYLPPDGIGKDAFITKVLGRSTIRELSPRSPLMVTRWRRLRSARHQVGADHSREAPGVLDRLSASGGGVNSIDQSAVGPLRAVR